MATRPALRAALPPSDDSVFVAPASFAQERLWFLDQLYPGTAAYVMPFPLRLRTRVRRDVLAAALADLVERHEALRTTFVAVDGRPQQVISPAHAFELAYTDLRTLPEASRSARCADLTAADAARPFDLARGPLFRAHLMQAADDDCALLLAIHHIVADGWSIEVLTRELGELYAARLQGRTPALPPLSIQYADFAQWQRELADRQDGLDEGLAFWTRELAGIDPLLQLPADHPRPAMQSLEGSVHAFVVEADLVDVCRQRARDANATLFAVLLAAYEVFLHRYTGQTDFAVGTPVANRAHAEVEHLVGLFINTLALPCRVDPESAFTEHLQRVRAKVVEALAHQHVPFEKVVEALVPDRNLGAPPIFQTLFVLQSTGTPGERTIDEPERDAIDGVLGNGTAKFDLTLTIVEANRKLYCTFEYCSRLFEASTIRRMARHFGVVLEALVSSPSTPIGRVSLTTPEERQIALIEWNRTEAPLPAETCLHRLVERCAAERLEQTAIRHGKQTVTYRELLRAADRIAVRLASLGVVPGDRVGVCLARTPHLVAALLGVLKCGAAYVPIDPSYPRARQQFIMRDSAAAALVTQQSLRWLFEGVGTPCLAVDDVDAGNYDETGCSLDPGPGAAAYVIYTSGSSGTPKGVIIGHRSAVAFVAWAERAFTAADWEAALASTSVCFDLSIFEIFGTLAAGGTIVLVRDTLDLTSADGPVTMINSVPSAVKELLELGLVPPTVRTINLAGEPLPNTLVQALYARTNVEQVVNLYGPTEDTTYATMAEIPRGHAGPVPIGRPIANRRAYVLDAALEPVPPGVVGEIFLGGIGVALGYNGLPELTRERFVDDPFVPGGRLFRTGDLGRCQADGTIEFLGRRDGQVKLRGYRIEVDEIREVVNAQPGVAESVVMVREDGGAPGLAAYVVARDGAELRPEALASGLARHLPAYMIPSRWMVLDRFPLTPNGKIDRKALPVPERTAASPAGELEAPRTAAEEALAEIWRAVLDLAEIGVRQDFFALGGHSLLLAQVAARVHEKTGVAVPLREYFEHPTIESLAARLVALTSLDAATAARIAPIPRGGDLRLSFAQERLWFLDHFTEQRELYTIPSVYTIDGPLDLTLFDGALQAVVRRHESLRTRFVAPDGRPLQVVEPQVEIDVDFYALDRLSAPERQRQVDELSRQNLVKPFDLEHGGLVRCAVVRESPRRFRVLLAMHHIVADGWSLRVFQRDLGEYYQALVERRQPRLPELPVQYVDFAAWQRRVLEGERTRALLAYWRRRLEGAPPIVTFPEDRPRPPVQTYTGAAVYFAIDKSLTAKLEELARSESATLFIVMLTAFHLLLRRVAGSGDVVTGTPVAGRHYPGLEDLIGFFVNTVPIRTRMADDGTVRDALAVAREAVLEGFDHQDAPFERIVDELKLERHLQHGPVFQVMFGFQNLVGARDLVADVPPGAAGSASDAPIVTTSKFDMTVALTEQADDIVGAIEYNTDLYDAATIERVIANYIAALGEVADDPGTRLADLRLLSDREHDIVVHEFNETVTAAPAGCCHELFDEQASLAPSAAAVVAGERALTYAELRQRADTCAAQLQTMGVGRGDPVAVAIAPRIEALVHALAIWKAGAALVPVNAAAPPARIDAILADARPKTLLATAWPQDDAGASGVTWLPFADQTAAVPVPVPVPAAVPVEPTDLGCVLYAADADDIPIGVYLEHRAVTANAAAVKEAIDHMARQAAAPARVAVSAAFFVARPLDTLALLLTGRSLHLLSDAVAQDAAARTAYCRDAGIDVVALTASELADHLDEGTVDHVAHRPAAIVAGVADRAAWQRLAAVEGRDVFVLDGPLEYPALAFSRVRDRVHQGVVCRSPRHARFYVLDSHGLPLPIGCSGEIWTGGEGLARGYWNRAALTAERFVTRRLGDRLEPLFRTGDRGRWLPDGTLAAAVERGPESIATAATAQAPERRDSDEPRTELEHALASIWAEVLGLERVGIHDSFFNLGGHSLLAIQAMVRIKNAGFDISAREIFERPSVGEMAHALAARGADRPGAPPEEPPMDDVDRMSDEEVDRLLRQMTGQSPGDPPRTLDR